MATEIPWTFANGMPRATLSGVDERGLHTLKFEVPEGSSNGPFAVIPVTTADADEATARLNTNVWHLDVDGQLLTVSPSIHFIGHFHSPNPVHFELVAELQ